MSAKTSEGDEKSTESTLSEEEKQIGRNIQAARRAKGMSQRELENALGSGTNVVSQWEQGRRRVTMPLQRIAKVLGVSVMALAAPAAVGGDAMDFEAKPGPSERPSSDLERARSQPKARKR